MQRNIRALALMMALLATIIASPSNADLSALPPASAAAHQPIETLAVWAVIARHPNSSFYASSGVRLFSAKSGKVVDTSGRLVGSISPDGKLVASSGQVFGRIESNGNLYDASGRKVGFRRDNWIYSASGTRVLEDDNQGRITSSSGRVIGRYR